MSYLIIVISVILSIFFPKAFWLILIACCAGIAWIVIRKRELALEDEERQRQIEESESLDSHGSAQTHFYDTTKNCASDPLDDFTRLSVSANQLHQGCPMVYKYIGNRVKDVDRKCLGRMVEEKDFDVELQRQEDGDIKLVKYGNTVATLVDKVDMCRDWLTKGHPVICQFSAFRNGFEKVALFFYKDVEAGLSQNPSDVVKLTSYRSYAKQETISFLEKGQKLFVEPDDNGKLCVYDIDNNPIGSLPKKYEGLYEDDMIAGILFDHSETKPNEDFEKDDIIIPFVKIYTEK